MNKPLLAALAAGALALSVSGASAQVLIGSVQNRGGDPNNYYVFARNGAGTAGSFFTSLNGASPAAVPVNFVFNLPGTVFGSNTVRAFVAFNVGTAGFCSVVGTQTLQPLAPGFVRVFVDPSDPTYGATYGNTTLIRADFTGASLSQDTAAGNPNPTFGAADVGPANTQVTLTSPYVAAIAPPERFTFSFSAGGNVVCPGPGQVLSNAALGGNGTFAGGPGTQGVPEPGTMGLLIGTGVTGTLFMLRRRRK